jgi:hypothetical protein
MGRRARFVAGITCKIICDSRPTGYLLLGEKDVAVARAPKPGHGIDIAALCKPRARRIEGLNTLDNIFVGQ